ncbi:MAG TPA: DNA replication and repair protein RecF [Longimicrobiales bacterium]|nr:DNA replication and repair protein RecF [Longimicrobiales bacterium]
MRLSALALRQFRNLGSQDLAIPPEGVALIGDNGQGKSNLLEAIYYLETFRSFRGARDDQLVTFGAEVFRVAGAAVRSACGGGEIVEVAAAFERRGRRKRVSLDGREPERLGDALGRLAAVIFSPSDVELVSGAPRDRRRFLDIVLSLNREGYLGVLQEYRRILARRNASLRQGLPDSVVTAWDHGLVRSGAEVLSARKRWVEGVSEEFGDLYARVSGDSRARMTYRPGVQLEGASTLAEIEAAFGGALTRGRERDRRLGSSSTGPHRDDVRLELHSSGEGVDLREYGSGGQRRTAALALRLVEARTIQDQRGEAPLILLDDVFAELDPGRSDRVLEVMEAEEVGQVILTAPKDSDVRLRRDALTRWRIEAGRIAS